jgi:hypothetical protein
MAVPVVAPLPMLAMGAPVSVAVPVSGVVVVVVVPAHGASLPPLAEPVDGPGIVVYARPCLSRSCANA